MVTAAPMGSRAAPMTLDRRAVSCRTPIVLPKMLPPRAIPRGAARGGRSGARRDLSAAVTPHSPGSVQLACPKGSVRLQPPLKDAARGNGVRMGPHSPSS